MSPPTYDIATVAEKIGVTAHTLRYWERARLIPPPGRDAAGNRAYEEPDIMRVLFVHRLRATGMPVRLVRTYMDLTARAGTEGQRLALLRTHREQLTAHLAAASEHLAAIDRKITAYQEMS